MNRLSSLRQWTERLGLAGVTGIGLLLFAGMYFITAALPVRERLHALEQDVVLADASPEGAGSPAQDIETDLAAFYAYFAAADSVAGALASLDEAVAGSRLAFDSAEYRLAREGVLRLARYEVTLPLQGSYGQVRGFVATLLETMPQAAVEDIAVKRESAGGKRLEARLRLSIYLAHPVSVPGGTQPRQPQPPAGGRVQ